MGKQRKQRKPQAVKQRQVLVGAKTVKRSKENQNKM